MVRRSDLISYPRRAVDCRSDMGVEGVSFVGRKYEEIGRRMP